MSEAVVVEARAAVTVIRISRPEKRNALNSAVVNGLQAAWQDFEASTARVAILTGEGDQAFCAGADLVDHPVELWRCVPGVGVDVSKPIIAAVSGWCIGAGVVLADACDLVVASEDARFVYPEAYVGMTGGLIASLPAHVPQKLAMELMLLGEPFSAERAAAAGLVNRVVPPREHVAEAMRLADRVSSAAPLVISLLKKVSKAAVSHSAVEVARVGARQLAEALEEIAQSEDRAEGRRSFRERRPPRFQGR